jgi:hypothetical protein
MSSYIGAKDSLTTRTSPEQPVALSAPGWCGAGARARARYGAAGVFAAFDAVA